MGENVPCSVSSSNLEWLTLEEEILEPWNEWCLMITTLLSMHRNLLLQWMIGMLTSTLTRLGKGPFINDVTQIGRRVVFNEA